VAILDAVLADLLTPSRLCISAACVRRRLSSVALCIVAKRRVLQQKLLLTAYEKSTRTKMNDLDFCLELG